MIVMPSWSRAARARYQPPRWPATIRHTPRRRLRPRDLVPDPGLHAGRTSTPPAGHPRLHDEPQGHIRPGAPAKTVVGEGEVVATTPSSSQIVVDHGEIKGFMDAMTMGYRVDPASLLAGVKPGDKVRFTIDVEQRAIVDIEKLR